MRKTINKLFLIITVISALLLTTGCDLFIKTNKGQVDKNGTWDLPTRMIMATTRIIQ